MSKPGDIQGETKHLILKLREIIESLNGEKTTIRFLLYKLIGMKDFLGETLTKIESTRDYDKLKDAINNARIRQSKVDPNAEYPQEVYGLPDDCFVDNKREVRHTTPDADVNAFVDKVKGWYDRDIWQDQNHATFLLVEKATVGDVLESVARKYQVPLCVSMGYFGRTFMLEIANRMIEAIQQNKWVRIGYVGDHDPSGMDMEDSLRWGNDKEGSQCAVGLEQLMTRGYDEYFKRCAWSRLAVRTEDFEVMDDNLKVNIKELEKGANGKVIKGDSRSPKYKAKYGDKGAEVEALDSQDLRDQVERWILSEMDKNKLEESRIIEEAEREKLAGLTF